MSPHRTLVGVDVGGTFTDLAFFDEATRSFGQPRPLPTAATRLSVSSRG
jgi:N-methylhydantoinase A/oxoprolinase/acetone carboxylase beta subunit